MAQFFAHMPWKGRDKVGKVTVREEHTKTTCVQIEGEELLDLLADFACERTGLERKLIQNFDFRGKCLTVHFVEDAKP